MEDVTQSTFEFNSTTYCQIFGWLILQDVPIIRLLREHRKQTPCYDYTWRKLTYGGWNGKIN